MGWQFFAYFSANINPNVSSFWLFFWVTFKEVLGDFKGRKRTKNTI